MISRYTDRVIAITAIAQAASLVNELATHGNCNQSSFDACMRSIFTLDADNVDMIYGDIDNLREGLATVEKFYTSSKSVIANVGRYFIGMCQLAKKLRSQKKMQQVIQTGIKQAQSQAEYFDNLSHTNVIENIADLYINTFGNLKYRIMIIGDQHHMAQADVLARIRCMLFAGIRAAVLWQQLGGRRWQLFLQRKKILSIVETLRS